MRSCMGLMLTGALLLGTAGESKGQVAVSVGNPYTGGGVFVGAPGFGYSGYGIGGYPGYYRGYNSGYLAGPGTFSYSSGYGGYVAPGVGYGYGYRPWPRGLRLPWLWIRRLRGGIPPVRRLGQAVPLS